MESLTERWFEARMAAPDAGTFERPTIHGRKIAFTIGPMTTYFMNQ